MKRIILVFLMVSLILPGCSKKKGKETQTPSPVKEEEALPELEQNLVYLTNQENPPEPKNVSFEESADQTIEKKIPDSFIPSTVGD